MFKLLITVMFEQLDHPKCSSAQTVISEFPSKEEAEVAFTAAKAHAVTIFDRLMTVTQVTRLY